jgi:hypothetical protein
VGQADLQLLLPHIRAYRRFCHLDVRLLDQQPVIDPVRRVALLAGLLQVVLENPVDEGNRRRQFRTRSLHPLSFFRHRVGQCLPHHAPVDTELPGHSFYRSHSELILSPDGFE